MQKNNCSEVISADYRLHYLPTDLHEIHSLFSELSLQLGGSGIVQVHDVEPTVSMPMPMPMPMPRIRSAVVMRSVRGQEETNSVSLPCMAKARTSFKLALSLRRIARSDATVICRYHAAKRVNRKILN